MTNRIAATSLKFYARLAGVMFLLYIAVGVTQMTVFGGATAGESMAAKLANMAQHATDVRVNAVLGLLTCFIALTLSVALYALTREQESCAARSLITSGFRWLYSKWRSRCG